LLFPQPVRAAPGLSTPRTPGNDPDRPRRIADAAGARTGLDELGVRWDEVEATLERLPSFVEEQDLWFSVANGLVVDDEVFTTARSALRV
jgi:hypothetical protein